MITQRIQESINVKQAILQDRLVLTAIERAIKEMTDCFLRGGKVFFCGNGGSAADAQHLAAELSGKFYLERRALPAEALHCNTSYITAVGNDYGFDMTYSRLIEGLAQKGDILVGLTTSGNSVNILNAFETARKKGVTTIAFTGQTGGKIRELADMLVNVASTDTPRIQEAHILIGHIICEQVEANIFA